MNNNLLPSSSRRCKCGRYITIGEWKAGIGVFGYTCPDCRYIEIFGLPLSEDYYKSFGLNKK